MKKQLALSALLILFTLLCCKTEFLTQETIAELDQSEQQRNTVIYYHKHFTATSNENIQIMTHSILKAGQNLAQLPEILYVFDGSVEHLKSFQARIIRSSGKTKKFPKKNLARINLSNAEIIQENNLFYLPIRDEIRSGDLIEMITVHEHTLPFLGFSFSPAETGVEAKNIICSFQISKNENLNFHVKNDSIQPVIIDTLNSGIYKFTWDHFNPDRPRKMFARQNDESRIFTQLAKYSDSESTSPKTITSWQAFGDCYLKLIQHRIEIAPARALAEELTRNSNTDKEKMYALAAYCQENIRYEQVYLEHGEFIPHAYPLIMERKYGDCKDYAMALYSLAHSIGLRPNLALCFRGRGREFYPEIPVSQFNHMIVYFSDNGNDYWYDGTNRTGLPGLVTTDLINQTALILEKGNSRLKLIPETPADQLVIQGKFRADGRQVRGKLTVALKGQCAIRFLLGDRYFNEADMKTGLYNWLRHYVNDNLKINHLTWQPEKTAFTMEADCEIPNAAIPIDSNVYLSLSRLFNQLLPSSNSELNRDDLFYFPFYNRVALELDFENLIVDPDTTGANSPAGFVWKESYYLPPGPFLTDEAKDSFIEKFNSIAELLNKKIKLTRKERS